MTKNATNHQALEKIEMMMRQEESRYRRANWLNESTSVTADDRAQTVTWYFQLADCLGLESHETLEIAMSILDRYANACSRTGTPLTLDKYHAASVSCLYTAIKCHEPEAISPELASKLSYGKYTPRQIEQTEFEILLVTNWAINPPTVMAYVRELMDLLPSSLIEESRRKDIMKMVQRQIDESLLDASYLDLDCADIAYIVLANALKSVLAETCKASILARVKGIVGRTLMVHAGEIAVFERKMLRLVFPRKATLQYPRSSSPHSVLRF